MLDSYLVDELETLPLPVATQMMNWLEIKAERQQRTQVPEGTSPLKATLLMFVK